MFSEEKIIKVLRKIKWPRDIVCPECGSKRIYPIKSETKIKKYTCKDCLRRFSDISQTIFHKTRLPLSKWLEAFKMLKNDPDVTARKIKNNLKISYTAARRLVKITRGRIDLIDKLLKELS
jgi:transposase-like protein